MILELKTVRVAVMTGTGKSVVGEILCLRSPGSGEFRVVMSLVLSLS